MKIFLGIDPGQSGGIARLNEVSTSPVVAWSMPSTERDIWDLLRDATCLSPQDSFCYIEKVHSMPKQGVVSSFKFGKNYGTLRMALVALSIPFDEVPPQTWMKYLGCMSGGDKNRTKAKAQQLFPELKVTHAIADALLIAEFARRTRL